MDLRFYLLLRQCDTFRSKRLQYSLMLLRKTDMTVKSIADEIGYAHAANFTIAFTRSFGNPPMYYRTARR